MRERDIYWTRGQFDRDDYWGWILVKGARVKPWKP